MEAPSDDETVNLWDEASVGHRLVHREYSSGWQLHSCFPTFPRPADEEEAIPKADGTVVNPHRVQGCEAAPRLLPVLPADAGVPVHGAAADDQGLGRLQD